MPLSSNHFGSTFFIACQNFRSAIFFSTALALFSNQTSLFCRDNEYMGEHTKYTRTGSMRGMDTLDIDQIINPQGYNPTKKEYGEMQFYV